MNQKPHRARALPILTALGAVLAAAALIAITAMTAAAAVPPNLGKAIETQRRLAAERPQDAAVWNDLGNLLLLAGQTEAAEAAYRHAAELEPHKVSALFNLGLLQQQEGKTGEARQLYEKVLEIEPNHAWAHYQMGTLYERKGDKSRAVRQYAQAFRLDPQLAFREVNPQIVENRLVTESLLLAYRRESAASEAPAIYDDPSRIRDLLVPPQAGAKEAAGDARKAEKYEAPRGAGAGAGAAAAGGQGAQRPTVLRPRDLPGGTNLGQATPPGSRPSGSTPGARPMPTPQTAFGVPGYVPPTEGNPNQAGAGGRQWTRPAPNPNLDGTQPGTVVTPPPSGLYYRPSVSSTGRLGTQVMPEQNG